MSRLEELRNVSDNTLHNLIADDALKFRILQKAAEQTMPKDTHGFRPVPILCTVLAALLIAVVALNALQAVPSSGPGDLNSFTAGNSDPLASSLFPDGYKAESVVSLVIKDTGNINSSEQCSMLAGILIDQASADETVQPIPDKDLTFAFEDGKALSFQVKEPYLIGNDGQCWYCPAFFSELNKLIQ